MGASLLRWTRFRKRVAPLADAGGPRVFCSDCRDHVTLAGAVRTLLASGHWAWSGRCPTCHTELRRLAEV
jgi:hypothetical protein